MRATPTHQAIAWAITAALTLLLVVEARACPWVVTSIPTECKAPRPGDSGGPPSPAEDSTPSASGSSLPEEVPPRAPARSQQRGAVWSTLGRGDAEVADELLQIALRLSAPALDALIDFTSRTPPLPQDVESPVLRPALCHFIDIVFSRGPPGAWFPALSGRRCPA